MNIININDNKLFYVGGVVRDELLGISSFDIDFTYEGNAIEFAKNLSEKGLVEIVQINEPFGTVRLKVNQREIDIASTRYETYEKKGHLPIVKKIGCSLQEDILRRDFTVNTLAKSTVTGEIIDFCNGIKDLQHKVLRVLHDESFVDDPTRILRALKFSIRFGFNLDIHTKNLQNTYLNNINYDMCYKRIKKELIETFNLNSQKAYEIFIQNKIYKLVTDKEMILPKINIEQLVQKYNIQNPWLVYVGTLPDISRLPLTKQERKIITDYESLGSLNSDFEIYKAFDKVASETVLLYAILKDEKTATRYLDYLKHIKITVNGSDLQALGLEPSAKYQKIFDEILKVKLSNPSMNKNDELQIVKQHI